MKIQIDTEKKIIRIEESINIDEFFNKLKVLFPKNSWKEYKLECVVITNWVNPIVIEPTNPIIPWRSPTYPQSPTVMYGVISTADNSTYNIIF